MKTKLEIYKYQNRKLYNTATSKYVRISEVLSMPRDSFIIRDYVTRGDITEECLLEGLVQKVKRLGYQGVANQALIVALQGGK